MLRLCGQNEEGWRDLLKILNITTFTYGCLTYKCAILTGLENCPAVYTTEPRKAGGWDGETGVRSPKKEKSIIHRKRWPPKIFFLTEMEEMDVLSSFLFAGTQYPTHTQ